MFYLHYFHCYLLHHHLYFKDVMPVQYVIQIWIYFSVI